ncbi:PEP/pyruvate-binding domain-containing protein [Desulfobacula sp.]|uniref:PEP/pyruvate-binding domain-containing protein n=1 Tax=Desulfobacula sp. TaxID=2593537 RepID=UPI002613D270|nr:PEP/pyruvate-binding domain-containing protein [Desulfobacula sp.]
MKPVLEIEDFINAGIDQVGGKALCLAKIHEQGFIVPKTICIPCQIYETYLKQTRLKNTILLEINRKPFKHMRWEEIWDISLRIRNLFLTTPIPPNIQKDLFSLIVESFGDHPVAVRSSAPGEDNAASSFAGLHDSFLNIIGADNIVKHIRLVWASLYSDAALLYRKELGLDIHTSQMAVVLQELIPSDRSGIFFGLNPSNSNESVIESVYGLNQALVDGDVEPDRWILSQSSGKILNHIEPVRKQYAYPNAQGVGFADLSERKNQTPPLDDQEVFQIWETGRKMEALFGRPQDMEWTFCNDQLIILQSRPITSVGFKDSDDKRSWYLTLHRSYENLKKLYVKIEHHLIPQMIDEATRLGQINFQTMTTKLLCQEIEQRQTLYDHWVKVYWAEFIPFAHGIRLFGQVYNDAVTPDDPYEFMALLENTGLKSMARNHLLEKLAQMIRCNMGLKTMLDDDMIPEMDHPFRRLLDKFVEEFGDLSCTTGSGNECQHGNNGIIRLLIEFAKQPPRQKHTDGPDVKRLQENYMDSFPAPKKKFAADVLHLGRESYRLRDDDNIHLGRIEARLIESVWEGQSRLSDPLIDTDEQKMLAQIPALSRVPDEPSISIELTLSDKTSKRWFKSRQIVGHPAGPGIATGKAKRIQNPQDLLDFKQGDVLVCSGVDPNMTFVIPLASAVVEERGGMLIHGAIIAREYGLPCITGASQAMQLIKNGDQITVDGYLGIITCKTDEL